MENPPVAPVAETTPAALLQPLAQAHAQIELWQRRAATHSVLLRKPPPEPTMCCGRGCNGCVWEGYFDALQFWCDDASDAVNAAESAAFVGP